MSTSQQMQADSAPALVDLTSARERHSTWTVALHWSSVVAIVVSVACGLAREVVENDQYRVTLLDIHRQAGLFVLLALALRLTVRFTAGMANHAGDLPPAVRLLALLSHLALYVALLLLPLLGMAVSNAHAVEVKLFGLFGLPSLVEADPDLADILTDFHVWGAWLLLVLVTMHVSAACWHHWVRRDAVLAAMLPFCKRRS